MKVFSDEFKYFEHICKKTTYLHRCSLILNTENLTFFFLIFFAEKVKGSRNQNYKTRRNRGGGGALPCLPPSETEAIPPGAITTQPRTPSVSRTEAIFVTLFENTSIHLFIFFGKKQDVVVLDPRRPLRRPEWVRRRRRDQLAAEGVLLRRRPLAAAAVRSLQSQVRRGRPSALRPRI